MKHFIRTFFSFLIVCVTGYIILLIVSGSFTPGIFRKNLNFKIGGYGHTNSRIKDIPNYSNLDILFVGSSHSYRGFDTRIFKKMNFKVFNLGSSSQSPIQQELLLDQYVNLLNPKLVVFEVFPKIMESDGVESALDVLANDKIDYKSLRMCCKTNNIKAYNTLIYGYYRQLFNLNANFTESKIKNDDAYVDGGFVERQVSFYKSSVKTNIKKISYQLNDLQLSTFKTILKSLNDKNIRYVLVQAPLTQNFYARYTNNEYVDSVYHSLGAYYNFNKLLSLKDSLFYDAHHLNQNGVNVFNEKFIEVLKQDHLLNQ